MMEERADLRGPMPFPVPSNGAEAVANALQQEFGHFLNSNPDSWLRAAEGVVSKLRDQGDSGYAVVIQQGTHLFGETKSGNRFYVWPRNADTGFLNLGRTDGPSVGTDEHEGEPG